METRGLLIPRLCVVALLSLATTANATIPIFVSGPTVASRNAQFPDNSTLVYGYDYTNQLMILRYSTPNWFSYPGDHFAVTGGYDGDPAALYIPGHPNNIMNCGHAAASPGYVYCGTGIWPDQQYPLSHYVNNDLVVHQVGSGQFPPGASPVLVHQRSILGYEHLFMFARSYDSQIWYAVYTVASSTWQDWVQVPPPPGDFFVSDPAASAYTSGDDLLIVCARRNSTASIACSKQSYGNGGSIVWSSWDPVPGQPATTFRPALARSSSYVFLLATRTFSNPQYVVSYSTFPVGGGSWAGFFDSVGPTGGFTSGPAAIGNVTQLRVMTVARAADSSFAFDVGAPDINGNFAWSNWSTIYTN